MATWEALFTIVNPAAGHGRPQRWLRELRHFLHTHKFEHTVHLTKGAGHAQELAQTAVSEGWPVVAVLGGDGTLHEVANALAGTASTLAVFPCGTGNDLARSMAIPTHLPSALEILQHGRMTAIDLGKDGDRFFVNIAGVGFSADVAARAHQLRFGRASFFVAVYQSLRHLQAYESRIRFDGQEIEVRALSIHVCNTRYSGAGMLFAPDADPADGWLDLMIVEELGAWEFARTFPRMYQEKGFEHRAIQRYRARRICIKTDPLSRAMHDGEVVGPRRLDVHVQPASLRILLPART